MDIGSRIEFLRKENHVTQQQLADYLSVLPQTVSRWETGGTPDIALLPKIALFFNITLDELFGMSNMDKVMDLVIRYSVLRDEKSFDDADKALSLELARTEKEKNEEDRLTLLAERMHLLLQKGWQHLKEAEDIADQLIEETKDPDSRWHLPARLQKMQFRINGGETSKYLRKSAKEFETNPNMETLQIYFWALVEAGQGETVLKEKENPYVNKLLAGNNNDSLTVWEILFHAAADAENLEFFENNFKDYEDLTRKITGTDNCMSVRMLQAKLYAIKGIEKEKEACKEKLFKEAESIENELMRNRAIENINKL